MRPTSRVALALLGALILAGTAHAFVDRTVETGEVRAFDVRLDRPFEDTYTWRAMVRAPSAGAWIWPDVRMAGEPLGASSDGPAGRADLVATVGGEMVTRWGVVLDSPATWSGTNPHGCRPRYACDAPILVAGAREMEVVVTARVVHDGGGSGAYRWTLGPMLVEVDRCPCFR